MNVNSRKLYECNSLFIILLCLVLTKFMMSENAKSLSCLFTARSELNVATFSFRFSSAPLSAKLLNSFNRNFTFKINDFC